MRRQEARSTSCQTCLSFSMGPLTPCLLISGVWPFRYTGSFVFSTALLLLARVGGQDDNFTYIGAMNADLGEPFTMTCPEGDSPFKW